MSACCRSWLSRPANAAARERSGSRKSGTGEEWGKDPINWFVGWDQSKKDPVVVLVMVEAGGAFEDGSEVTAAPAVRNILETYYGVETSSSSSSSSSGP